MHKALVGRRRASSRLFLQPIAGIKDSDTDNEAQDKLAIPLWLCNAHITQIGMINCLDTSQTTTIPCLFWLADAQVLKPSLLSTAHAQQTMLRYKIHAGMLTWHLITLPTSLALRTFWYSTT